MKIEQTRPNQWMVRKQVEGKRYKVYFDHKPTQREALTAITEKVEAADTLEYGDRTSMEAAAKDYIKDRPGLSPTTATSYSSIIKNTPPWFLKLGVGQVTAAHLQKLVDGYSGSHSAKSTKNLYTFYASILAEKRPHFKFVVKLPKAEKKRDYEPTTDDIRAILAYEDGSARYGLVFRFLCLGLRRGEACALTSSDLNRDNIITINKTMVYTGGEHYIKSCPKTDASNRRILVPPEIAARLRDSGKVYEGAMSNINRELHKAQTALGIPAFRLHTLRHFAAAYMIQQGFSATEVEDYMGWEHGSETMRRVYAYVLDPHESQKNIASAFGKL